MATRVPRLQESYGKGCGRTLLFPSNPRFTTQVDQMLGFAIKKGLIVRYGSEADGSYDEVSPRILNPIR